ncbi:MAG: heavy metal transporter [Microbacterium sp.]|jgi:sterol desaturase/sphingolipid hydroxylase (fatty acid hydroxylase superfamily)|uniref:heavy metal transporter n=1 Tax=Microbacterium sp. TaxID=51671 RepID=UPI0026166CCD|nr:heavy metal transporter [Microbacterium sp.]MDF2561411.1 heavy metal transporter [Microbacterium sp.]
MTEKPKRVRVTADLPDRRPSTFTRGIALPGAPVDEADAVYARALMRSQLRLALGTVAGFVVVVIALTLAIALIPEIGEILVWGLPLSWLLQAYAFYPIIVVFAVLYVRTAGRNERRYRALRDRE